MPSITIEIQEEYDQKINMLKAERKISSKAKMIEEMIKEYFNVIKK